MGNDMMCSTHAKLNCRTCFPTRTALSPEPRDTKSEEFNDGYEEGYQNGCIDTEAKLTQPGPGSGALREALSSRLLQWRKIHASTKGQFRTNYEEGRDNMLLDCIEGLAADVQNFGVKERELPELSDKDGWVYDPDAKLAEIRASAECDICGQDTPHFHGPELVEIERFVRPAFEKTTIPQNAFERIAKNPDFPYSDQETEHLWQHFVSGWFASKKALAALSLSSPIEPAPQGASDDKV